MKQFVLASLLGATLIASPCVKAEDMMQQNKNGHMGMMPVHIIPLAVSGDHTHKKGQWMASYSYMRMDMGGMREGTHNMSDADVLSYNAPTNLRVVPTKMVGEMHMLGGMVGVTDSITVMAMAPFINKYMESRVYNMMGTALVGTSSMESTGWGDLQFSAVTPLWHGEKGTRLNASLGLSLPTGATDIEDDMLMPSGMRMRMRSPYGMQLGTGTYDLLPSLVYAHDDKDWSYGAAYKARFHLGRNNHGYTKGDWHKVTGWAGRRLSKSFGLSASVSAITEDSIDGRDSLINGMMPGANPDYYGGEKIDLGLTAGWQFYKKNTLKFEASAPIYQNLNGPQLEKDYMIGLKWQAGF